MRTGRITFAATLAMLLVAGQVAAQEGPRFGAEELLPSLNLLANQHARLSAAGERTDGIAVDFSFHGESSAPEPGFLYLQDGDEAAPLAEVPVAPAPAAFTPRLSALGGLDRTFNASGLTRAGSSFTPRYTNAEITLRIAPHAGTAEKSAVDLKIASAFLVENRLAAAGLADGGPAALGPFDRRTRNLGVSLGYLGFTLGASMTRESGGLDGTLEGVDLGLGYSWSSFSTEISVGEYSRSDAFSAAGGRERDFYKLELGAAYALSERIRFSGGVRLFDYSNRFGPGRESVDRAGVLFLGTRLNF